MRSMAVGASGGEVNLKPAFTLSRWPIYARALAAPMRPSFVCLLRYAFPKKSEGGGAPGDATCRCPRHADRCCHLHALRARCGHYRSPLAFRRSAAALVAASKRRNSAQAALHASGGRGHYPRHQTIALKRSTSRAGRNAGGVDARTARERSDKLRPQEPHPPHQSAVTGGRPSMSGIFVGIRNGDECVIIGLTPQALYAVLRA